MLKACDDVCGMKRVRSKGGTWWLNEELKEAVLVMKEAHTAMCQNSTEDNKRRYKRMKNKGKKAVAEAMREKAEDVLTELQNCPNWMLRLVIGLKTDCKEVEGVREEVMESCVSVRMKEVKSRRIIWKGS